MADDETNDTRSHASSDDSSDDGSDSEPVEMLVSGRERRKTAGNRYDRDLVLEEAAAAEEDEEDEINLLFADNEEEEDEEFKSDDEDEDAEMSSEDDDDQGPTAAADDLEGEKALQNQAKVERQKKRKADLALTTTAGIRKKARIDPTQLHKPPPKPSKRKERVSWLPDQDAVSGRTSLRKQTIAHREITLARLKESEAQSRKMKVLKEKRDKEKAKDAPKEMTQADRLAEAEKVERRNAKSLNRWETMEKKRADEQAAKLAALKDRKLEGPVLTWLSSKSKWTAPRPGKTIVREFNASIEGSTEPKKRGRKSKAYHEQMAAAREAEGSASGVQIPPVGDTIIVARPPLANPPQSENQEPVEPQITFTAPRGPDDFLQGIHEYATMQSEGKSTVSSTISNPPSITLENEAQATAEPQATNLPERRKDVNEPPQDPIESATPGLATPSNHSNTTADAKMTDPMLETGNPSIASTPDQSIASLPLLVLGNPSVVDVMSTSNTDGNPISTAVEQQTALPDPPEPPPIVEDTTRNLVVLDKFDDLEGEARQEYGLFFNSRKGAKPTKQTQELCPITTLPARYRDPATGIGYANLVAYKKLQDLREHQFRWSSMLGCYIGKVGATVARGVPEGFLGP